MLAALSVILSGCFSARAVAAESLRVMPLGNSITDGAAGSSDDTGYRRSLYLSLIGTGYNVDFVGSQAGGVPTDFDHDHEGHSGEIASWLNPRMNGPTAYWLATYQPEVILYHIGTNNLDSNDIAAYVQDANETIEIVYDYDPNITIILAKIILTRDDPNRNTRTHNYNLLLESIAQDWENAGYSIIVVDMESALNYITDMDDNLHPNDVGYAKMADVWYDALDNFLGVAPVITSIPVTDASVGQLYNYPSVEGDFNNDGTVDLLDFAELALVW